MYRGAESLSELVTIGGKKKKNLPNFQYGLKLLVATVCV